MSHRIKQQCWEDIHVIRPKQAKTRIKSALEAAFTKADDYIKYDLTEVKNIVIWHLFGKYPKNAGDENKFICSEFTQYYGIQLGVESYFPKNLKRPFFTPQDHKRLFNKDEFKIIVE
jgi:hypothetical protein